LPQYFLIQINELAANEAPEADSGTRPNLCSHLVPLPAGACCNGLVLAWGCQPGVTVRPRAFIAGIAGSAAWPLAARAQEKVRRVGVLLPAMADDAEFQARLGAFQQGLGKSGWEIGAEPPR